MRKLTDEQLILLTGSKYSQKEIKELRLIEKCVNVLQSSLTQEEFNLFSELMCNGWSDVLVRLMNNAYEINNNTFQEYSTRTEFVNKLFEEYKDFRQHCGEIRTCPKNCHLQHMCFCDWINHYVTLDLFDEIDKKYNESIKNDKE